MMQCESIRNKTGRLFTFKELEKQNQTPFN